MCVYVTHIFIVRDLQIKTHRKKKKKNSERIDARFF